MFTYTDFYARFYAFVYAHYDFVYARSVYAYVYPDTQHQVPYSLWLTTLILSTKFRIVCSVEKHSLCLYYASDYAPFMLRLCSSRSFLIFLKSFKYVLYGFDLYLTTNIHSNSFNSYLSDLKLTFLNRLSTNCTDLG